MTISYTHWSIRLGMFCAVYFSCLCSVKAQQSFSLSGAIEYALENHYTIHNANLEIERSKKKVMETTAIGLPQVNAMMDYQNRIKLPFAMDFDGPIPEGMEFALLFSAQHNTNFTLEASQLIFDGTYIVGLQAAKTYKELSERQKIKNKSDVKINVSNAYYLALVTEENVTLLKKTLGNLHKNFEESKAIYAQGLIEETDVDQLELMLSDIEISLLNAENQQQLSLLMLKLQMGFPLEETIILTEELDDVVNNTKKISTNFNLEFNPDFKILEVQENLLKLDVKRYKMERLPSLGAFYQYSQQGYQTKFDFYQDINWLNAQTAGMRLNVPIFSSGMQKAKIGQAKIELEKLQNSKLFMENSLQLQFQNASNHFVIKQKTKENTKRSWSLAEKIFNSTEIKHQAGLASSFDLLQARNQLLEAQGKYIQSLFDLLGARLDIDKLVYTENE